MKSLKIIIAFTIIILLKFSPAFSLNLNWYAWNGFGEYKALGQNFFEYLPNQTKSIFVSFSSKEIEELKENAKERNLLEQMISDSKKHNISVGLLLGDPMWVLPQYQQNLIDLIEFFAQFKFDSVNLDIEPSQLPLNQRSLWHQNISQLIDKVKSIYDIPVYLSMNYKDIDDKLLEKLKNNGLSGVIIMIYSTNVSRVIDVSKKIIIKNPYIDFYIAQSYEPLDVLSKTESYYTFGWQKTLMCFEEIDSALYNQPNFQGIFVQSLDYFLR